MRHMPFAVGLVIGALVLLALGMVERRAALLPVSDFAGIWAGGRAVVSGADPYDAATWSATARRSGTQPPDTAVYGYTPWIAFAMAPLALAPLGIAALLWSIGGIAAAVAGVLVLMRARPVPAYAMVMVGVALLASQPALTSFMVGQWTFLLVGALAFAVAAALDARPSAAVALAASLAKPQLWLLALPAILVRAPRAALPFTAIVAAMVIGTSLAMPHWWSAWATHVAPARVTDPPRAATLGSLFAQAVGPAGPPLAYAAVLTIGLVAVWRFGARSDAALAILIATSLLAAPYAWSYDWLLLIVPLIIGTSALAPVRPRRALILTLGGATALLILAPVLYGVAVVRGRETLGVLVPLAVVVALVATLWPLGSRAVRRA
jgi:hypothetical protein